MLRAPCIVLGKERKQELTKILIRVRLFLSMFTLHCTAIGYNVNTTMCDSPFKRSARHSTAPLQKSRRNHRSYL